MPEIKDWIKKQLNVGYTPDQIRESLQKSGWNPDLVNEVLVEMHGTKKATKLPFKIMVISFILIVSFGLLVYNYLGKPKTAEFQVSNLVIPVEGI